jgi:hypothetical protein
MHEVDETEAGTAESQAEKNGDEERRRKSCWDCWLGRRPAYGVAARRNIGRRKRPSRERASKSHAELLRALPGSIRRAGARERRENSSAALLARRTRVLRYSTEGSARWPQSVVPSRTKRALVETDRHHGIDDDFGGEQRLAHAVDCRQK